MPDPATNPATNPTEPAVPGDPAKPTDLPTQHQAALRTLAQTITVLQEEHRRLAAEPACDATIRDLGHLAAGAREGLVLVGIEHGVRESRAHVELTNRMRALGEVNA